MKSPGKINEYGQGTYVTAKLYNFDVGKFDIKTEHSAWLIGKVVPKLWAGGSLTIIGLASRTGTDAMNMRLSENRSRAVIDLLRRLVPNNFKVAVEVAMGERAALFAGVRDGVEQENWRGVVISAWDKATPPPPPLPPPPQPKPQSLPIDRKFLKRWLGFGFKSGGQLGIGGVESTTAYLLNLGDFETFDLQIISSRWGLGLGGSGGFVAVIGFGFSIPYELHGKSENDWGVNVAFTEKIFSKSVLHSIQGTIGFVDDFKKTGVYIMPNFKKAKTFADRLKALANVRDLLHTLYAGLETSKRSGVVVIDLPFLGKGLEVSAFLTRGTMYVSNPSHWIEPN